MDSFSILSSSPSYPTLPPLLLPSPFPHSPSLSSNSLARSLQPSPSSSLLFLSLSRSRSCSFAHASCALAHTGARLFARPAHALPHTLVLTLSYAVDNQQPHLHRCTQAATPLSSAYPSTSRFSF